MKLKKFLFSGLGLMLTSLFSEVVGSSLVYSNNKSNLYKTTVRKENEIPEINSATMMDYGQKITNAKGVTYRRQRLTLRFTKEYYNLLLIVVQMDAQKLFLEYLQGEKAPLFHKEIWKFWHNELINTCRKTSAKYHLTPNFFYDLFINWLKSEEGWTCFKNVFDGENRKNNLYVHPSPYSRDAAELQFRKEGIIIQFYFTPISDNTKTWKVFPFCRAYPQISGVEALVYYYTHLYETDPTRDDPPLISFDIKQIPSSMMVSTLWKLWIKPAIEWNFSVPLDVASQDLIKPEKISKKDKVSTDPLHPTKIRLAFYDGLTPWLYVCYPIKLVAHFDF